MSPTPISSNQAPAHVSGAWLSRQPAKVAGSALPKDLPRIAQQREAARRTTSEGAGAFESVRKANNTSSGKVWEQKDGAARKVMEARSKQTALPSALRNAGIAAGEQVSIGPMQTIRRQNTASESEPVAPKKEGGTSPQASKKGPREKVTAAQVFKLGAVAATLPLRVAFFALYLPVIALSQAGMSLAKAIKGDKSKVPQDWDTPKPEILSERKGFDTNSMILKSDEKDFKAMDQQAAVLSHARKIDPSRIVAFSDADAKLERPASGDGQLGKMTLNSRLDIVTDDLMADNTRRSPEDVAKILRNKGLQNVGVINIDSGLAGSKEFLVKLGNALKEQGVNFGWLANTTGISTNTRKVGKLGDKTYTWSMIALPWKRMTARMTPASLARTVVQGNADINFAKTPFHATKPTIASKYFQA